MSRAGDTSEVREWWSANPQLYGETFHAAPDKKYFEKLDQAMLNYRYDGGPRYEQIMEKLFDPNSLAGKKGLEIGYGSGWVLEWLTRKNMRMTGVDLTPRAHQLATARFSHNGLNAEILQGDARELPFADASFDLVCSIGVLHHSPDTQRSLDQVHRVLKPGGKAVIMLYARDSIFAFFVHLVRGWLEMEHRFTDTPALWRRWTDGWEEQGNSWTTPFSQAENKQLFSKFTSAETISFYFDLPHPAARFIPPLFRRAIARRFGWFRYVVAVK